MKTNPVRSKLKRGEPSIGTWLTLPDPFVAQLMARTGFDWLTIEMEHTPTTIETAAQSFAIVAASGCVPLVRVPLNTVQNIKRVLDVGVWGVVVPLVNSRAEAEAVVRAARYRPLGERSIGGQLHAANFGTDAATYYARANDEILVVVMAEHVQAVENIDSILSVPGLDAVFVGPNDLHASMGLAPAFDSDASQFNDALRRILASAKRHGVAAGIHVLDAAQAQRRIREGWQFIAIASEAGFMLSKAAEITKALGLGASAAAIKY
ncbi:MAG TPA: aldolase/citrate lyase family protein [Methylomirabilota bacterium]|nr:aldolase/citrate lyase family protein [Methylomirabilota bacterium]